MDFFHFALKSLRVRMCVRVCIYSLTRFETTYSTVTFVDALDWILRIFRVQPRHHYFSITLSRINNICRGGGKKPDRTLTLRALKNTRGTCRVPKALEIRARSYTHMLYMYYNNNVIIPTSCFRQRAVRKQNTFFVFIIDFALYNIFKIQKRLFYNDDYNIVIRARTRVYVYTL